MIAAHPHAARRLRLPAARTGRQGMQVMLIEQLVGRLAGGFSQLVDEEMLQRTLLACLPSMALGELEGIRDLPGTSRALLSTLHKCWLAGFDLQATSVSNSRIAALAVVDAAVRAAFLPSLMAPPDLAAAALANIALAPKLLGAVDVVGLAELDPCWRPVLLALADVTKVRWLAGTHAIPAWLAGSPVTVEHESPLQPHRRVVSAAQAAHEALEAMRWVRQLLTIGRASAGEIALASTNPPNMTMPCRR